MVSKSCAACLLLLCATAAHAVAGRQLQAAPSKGPKAPDAPTLYDCLTLKKLDTLKKLVDAAGLDVLLKDVTKKYTLLAPDEDAFKRFFGDCKAKGVDAVNVPPACSVEALIANKPLLQKLLRYTLLNTLAPIKQDKKTWSSWKGSGTVPWGVPATLLSDKKKVVMKMKLRYSMKTKTYEAHGTGRDGFVRPGAGLPGVTCGAGLLHVIDNVITPKPGTY